MSETERLDLDAIEEWIRDAYPPTENTPRDIDNLARTAFALVARVRELEGENEALAKMVPAEAWVSNRELTPEEYEYGAQIPIPTAISEAALATIDGEQTTPHDVA